MISTQSEQSRASDMQNEPHDVTPPSVETPEPTESKGTQFIKRFLEWIGLKEKLEKVEAVPPLVNVRDLWWISFGENIGQEISGKGAFFSRPGLVLKKLSHTMFLVAPTTTKKREGTWYVPIMLGRKETYVCLHQVRVIDYRRLSVRMGQLDEDDFRRAKEAFLRLYS